MPNRMTKTKNRKQIDDQNKCWPIASYITGENAKWYGHFGKQYDSLL